MKIQTSRFVSCGDRSRRIRSSLLAASIAALLSSCVTSRGFQGSVPDGVTPAVVRGDGVKFLSVNGISLSDFSQEVEVLPGKNSITLSVNASNYIARAPEDPTFLLEFTAESAAKYVVTGRRGNGRLCAWKLNVQSGDPDFSSPAGCIVRQ